MRPRHPNRFLRTKNVYKRGEEEIRKRRWWLGGEPARRRLGRATVAELLRLRHHSRRDSERADQARSESLRNLLASTNRSPAIGLRSCSSGTVRQPLHLSPIDRGRAIGFGAMVAGRLKTSLLSSSRVFPQVLSKTQALGRCGTAQAPTSRLATAVPIDRPSNRSPVQ